MTLARRRPLPETAQAAARQLKQAEATIALLERVRPTNLTSERARLLAGLQSGKRPAPELTYAPPVALTEVRRALAQLGAQLDGSDTEQRLLSARAEELALEAELALHVGASSFRALAARRFPLQGNDAELRAQATQLLQSPAAPAAALPLYLSDDEHEPLSLLSQISCRAFAEKLPIRLHVDAGLVPLAAVADDTVRVRAGARLTADVGRRITLHEVEGHLLPRARGKALGGVFLAGSAGASEDEEGRAILLEERAGLLDGARRRELARRYLAAASVRDGAELWDTVELLGRTGADAGSAIELSCRVHRGGGLGRELIYLSGYLRVAWSLAREPRLEQLLASGRVSLVAARELLDDSVELDDDGDVI